MVSLWRCFVLGLVLSFSVTAFSAETFPKKKIVLGNKTLTVEVATTPEQQERGLMFRESLGENDGMLFVFKNEETRFFWMKNTLIDLAIGYFNKSGNLIDVQEMKSGKGLADSMLPSYASAQPAKYALEMNKGWFDRNKIKLGTKLKINQ
ncbi:MAG: DUF192 domain-containing protein [Bdellovibrio sp.]|nr:DUF192 domain-containing protein [Bdellovibrio sp.]